MGRGNSMCKVAKRELASERFVSSVEEMKVETLGPSFTHPTGLPNALCSGTGRGWPEDSVGSAFCAHRPGDGKSQ